MLQWWYSFPFSPIHVIINIIVLQDLSFYKLCKLLVSMDFMSLILKLTLKLWSRVSVVIGVNVLIGSNGLEAKEKKIEMPEIGAPKSWKERTNLWVEGAVLVGHSPTKIFYCMLTTNLQAERQKACTWICIEDGLIKRFHGPKISEKIKDFMGQFHRLST